MNRSRKVFHDALDTRQALTRAPIGYSTSDAKPRPVTLVREPWEDKAINLAKANKPQATAYYRVHAALAGGE